VWKKLEKSQSYSLRKKWEKHAVFESVRYVANFTSNYIKCLTYNNMHSFDTVKGSVHGETGCTNRLYEQLHRGYGVQRRTRPANSESPTKAPKQTLYISRQHMKFDSTYGPQQLIVLRSQQQVQPSPSPQRLYIISRRVSQVADSYRNSIVGGARGPPNHKIQPNLNRI
jgi:hypothetical protein